MSLEERLEEGTFRRDLYYRLNVVSIELLPLRQRHDDILPLAEHFLDLLASRRSRAVTGFADDARHLGMPYSTLRHKMLRLGIS